MNLNDNIAILEQLLGGVPSHMVRGTSFLFNNGGGSIEDIMAGLLSGSGGVSMNQLRSLGLARGERLEAGRRQQGIGYAGTNVYHNPGYWDTNRGQQELMSRDMARPDAAPLPQRGATSNKAY